MNFKIENNNLNLTNYQVVARHFEAMAAKGWLIHKILGRSLFIYKKIEPERLALSIAPYEIETVFTKKTKEEIEEFKTVCENVGWNYVTQYFNLHIYYKQAGADATPIQTDTEEEFKILEELGNKQIKASYLQIAIFLFIGWMNIRGIFTDIYWMKDGISQLLAPVILMVVVTETIETLSLKRFLKINKKNIEINDPIEYNNSKSIIEKIISILFSFFLILFAAYILYSGLGLNNKVYLISLVPVTIAISIGVLYRIFVKPAKKSLSFKKIVLAVVIIFSTIISNWILFSSIDGLAHDERIADIKGLKVLTTNDFSDKDIEADGYLRKNISLLIPKSYSYSSYNGSDKRVETEYSYALNEELAKNLVKRYIKQAEREIIGMTSYELEISLEEDSYIDRLGDYGLKESDYKNLKKLSKKEAIEMAQDLMKARSVTKDSKNLWNLDEVYFLRYDRKEIVIRQGKEVFYLEEEDLIEGENFTNPEIIKIVKRKLDL